ncbi:MAG: maleylpyruvate isomerase family mycothiol-dependent enzyme [Actinomycetota bacterium]|nr:maleylpyruvate isomerase family mycothiol-dependent enzyme [Actinomycetota bacterium]
MNWQDYLEAIARDSELLAAAGRKGLEQDVPCCEGWSVRDVVGHTGAVHRQKEAIVRDREGGGDPEYEEPPGDDLLMAWFEDGADRLMATLAATDPATPVATWYPSDLTVGFWYRRMAHETLIHRVDAEQAHGMVTPIDPELAADGVDEILRVFMADVPEWGSATEREGTIRLIAGERSWVMSDAAFSGTSPGGKAYDGRQMFAIVDGHDDGTDATVVGAPEALDLWLWGRGSLDDLAVTGDEDLVSLLRETAAEDT